MELALVGDGQHCAEAFEIDIRGADVMVRGHRQLAYVTQRNFWTFSYDIQQSALGRRRWRGDEIHDRALMLADDTCVGLIDEILYGGGVPVVAASQAARAIHSLLNDGPFAFCGDDETVKVELKSIGDRVVVDSRRQATGAHQRFAIEAGAFGVAA